MLTFSFSQIKNSDAPLIKVDEELELGADFFARAKGLLLDAKNVRVQGEFFYDVPYVTGNFKVTADVTVPSTRSLEPVLVHETFTFTESYSETKPSQEELDEIGTIITVKDDLLDLQTAVEDNLLLNLPSYVLTEKERKDHVYPKGQGWEVISEKEYQKTQAKKTNPAFDKLKDLFPEKNTER